MYAAEIHLPSPKSVYLQVLEEIHGNVRSRIHIVKYAAQAMSLDRI